MTRTTTIRRAEVDDAQAFSDCHIACWREAFENLWDEERFEELDPIALAADRREQIAAGVADHVLAEADGEVVGIAIAGPTRDQDAPTERELYAIYVRQAQQGSGISDNLLEAVLGTGPASLWSYRDNPRASAFYVNHDFIPDGGERNDRDGLTEIRMVRR